MILKNKPYLDMQGFHRTLKTIELLRLKKSKNKMMAHL